jgi:hypothetical protein
MRVRVRIRMADTMKSNFYSLTIEAEEKEGEVPLEEVKDEDLNEGLDQIEKTPGEKNESENKVVITESQRLLHEFQTHLKEKGLPKSIKTIVRIYLLTIILIIAIAALSLYFCYEIKTANDDAINSLSLTHQRSALLPEIIYYCMKVRMLAEGMFDYNTTLYAEIAGVAKGKVPRRLRRFRAC